MEDILSTLLCHTSDIVLLLKRNTGIQYSSRVAQWLSERDQSIFQFLIDDFDQFYQQGNSDIVNQDIHYSLFPILREGEQWLLVVAIRPSTPAALNSECIARILLVEDDVLAARMVIQLLEKLDCYIEHVDGGEKALVLARQQKFDLIFLDIGLPDMSGITVAEKIRELEGYDYDSVPIIALTGHASNEKKQECLEVGMQDMLPKPLTCTDAMAYLDLYMIGKSPLVDAEQLDQHTQRLPIIDLKNGAKLANGDINYAQEIVDLLMQQLPADIIKLKSAWANNKLKAMYDVMHKICGGLCYCGVPRLRNAAFLLKEALEEKRYEHLPELLTDFMYQVNLLEKAHQQCKKAQAEGKIRPIVVSLRDEKIEN